MKYSDQTDQADKPDEPDSVYQPSSENSGFDRMIFRLMKRPERRNECRRAFTIFKIFFSMNGKQSLLLLSYDAGIIDGEKDEYNGGNKESPCRHSDPDSPYETEEIKGIPAH